MKVSAQSSAICQPCFDKNTVEATSLIRDLELEIFFFLNRKLKLPHWPVLFWLKTKHDIYMPLTQSIQGSSCNPQKCLVCCIAVELPWRLLACKRRSMKPIGFSAISPPLGCHLVRTPPWWNVLYHIAEILLSCGKPSMYRYGIQTYRTIVNFCTKWQTKIIRAGGLVFTNY